MKRIFFTNVLLSIIVAAGLTSCQSDNKKTGAECSQEQNVLAVDISDWIKNYRRAQDSISAIPGIEDYMIYNIMMSCLEGDSIFYYCEPRHEDDYAVEQLPQLQHPELKALIKAYNSMVTFFNIYSQFEIWLRADFTSDTIDVSPICEEIRAFSTSIPMEADSKAAIEDIQKILPQLLEIGEGREAEYERVSEQFHADSKKLMSNTDSLYNQPDSLIVKFASQMHDWKSFRSTQEWEKIAGDKSSEDACVERTIEAMRTAPDIEKQYMIVMCSEGLVPDFVTRSLMRVLLGSGIYTHNLFNLWMAWRSCVQINYFGRSRDSVIADAWFNEYRKKAFMTTIYHLDQYPDDQTAWMNALLLSGTGNVARNGSCLYGNDANLDYMNYFYDHDDDNE